MQDKKLTIMIIEDEDMLLQAIDMKLKKNGFMTLSCTSAQQALDYLNSIPSLPDAIWLDFYLDDMNGIDFMNIIKKKEEWKNIPVIVVSNSASDEKKKTMLALGAKYYILKAEYKLDKIIDIVRDIIQEGKVGEEKS